MSRNRLLIVLLPLLLLLTGAVALTLGSAGLSVTDLASTLSGDGSEANRVIVLRIRLPRIILAALVGVGLAVSGTVFQGVFRNPLAEPYILGVSGGAALGVTIYSVSGAISILGAPGLPLAAFLGAMLASITVLFVGGMGKTSTTTLLLAGIAVGFFMSAIISFLMFLNREALQRIILWTLGSFSAASYADVAVLAPLVVVGSGVLFLYARDLNVLVLGDEAAQGLGVPSTRTRVLLLAIATLIAASCVAVSGIIGFVGLIIPHMLRILTGPDHRTLLPLTIFGGAIFLLIADTLARTILA
ncbi:MAG: iron chelate uptake ABC transporter family permease subunit, partial [Spirochaetes bacterium]|nr:iron chelate uptake ABC transporter family permease subunit [Spirochaetota bacterium]